MKPVAWLCGMVMLSYITGCASLFTSTGKANEQIDYWLDRQEYGKALTLVAELKQSPSSAGTNLQETEENIRAHIARYERQVIATADNSAAVGDWGTAFDAYRDALSRVPDSSLLQQGERRLVQRHTEHLRQLELDRLIAKGEWTLKDLEISKLAEANSSHGWFGQYSLNRKIASAHDVALVLAEHGKRALEHKDLTVAKRVLPLAVSLSNAGEIEALHTQYQEMQKEEELRILHEQKRIVDAQRAEERMRSEQQDKRQRSATTSQEQKKSKRLMADFKKACQERDFEQAQQLMSQLKEQGVNDREFETLRKQLATEVTRHVKHLTKIGVIHYSQQQYDEALNVWKQAHALDPDNELLTVRIKRVTRVLDKLQNLRSKSSATQ